MLQLLTCFGAKNFLIFYELLIIHILELEYNFLLIFHLLNSDEINLAISKKITLKLVENITSLCYRGIYGVFNPLMAIGNNSYQFLIILFFASLFKPLRVDSVLRALSTLRGLRGAPKFPHYAERRSLSDSK